MKCLIILLLTFALLVDNGNCGVIANIFGTVKNTTNSIRNEVKSWWNYGKDLVFGEVHDGYKKSVSETENAYHKTVAEIEKDNDIVKGFYYDTINKLSTAPKNIEYSMLGENTSEPQNSFVIRLYNKLRHSLDNVVHNIGNQADEKTKHIREGIKKTYFKYRNNLFYNATNSVNKAEENFKNGIENIRDETNSKAKDLKDSIETNFNKYSHEIQDGVGRAMNEVRASTNSKVNEINASVSDKVDGIKNNIVNYSNNVKYDVENRVNKLKNDADSVRRTTDDKVTEIKHNIESTFEQNMNEVKKDWKTVQEGLK